VIVAVDQLFNQSIYLLKAKEPKGHLQCSDKSTIKITQNTYAAYSEQDDRY